METMVAALSDGAIAAAATPGGGGDGTEAGAGWVAGDSTRAGAGACAAARATGAGSFDSAARAASAAEALRGIVAVAGVVCGCARTPIASGRKASIRSIF